MSVWLLLLSIFGFLTFRHESNELAVLKTNENSGANLKQFLAGKSISMYLIMFLAFASLNGFLFYFVPVFSAENGLLETEISLLFVLHMVGMMFFGPLIAKKIEARNVGHKGLLIWAMALSIASLLMVAYNSEMIFLIAAVFIRGCSNSLGLIYFPLYFSEMEETKVYGTEKSMSVYSAVDNIGGAIGPFIFAWAITFGISSGFALLSAVAAATMLVFFKVNENKSGGIKDENIS